jgi:hypothetical protein
MKQGNTISGEVSAAIATALYIIAKNEQNAENNKLTIKRVTNNQSSWNSKIHGLRKPLRG